VQEKKEILDMEGRTLTVKIVEEMTGLLGTRYNNKILRKFTWERGGVKIPARSPLKLTTKRSTTRVGAITLYGTPSSEDQLAEVKNEAKIKQLFARGVNKAKST